MKRWYVVQVYAGSEDKVKTDLDLQIKSKGLEEVISRVSIPSVKLKTVLAASAEDADQRLFPGYVLVEMELVPEAMQLVTSAPRVVKFLGGRVPMALSDREVNRIVERVKEGVAAPVSQREFVEGSEVDIIDGPFAGFVGLVERSDEESEKLKVMVSIFGRLTPVELSFDQVK
jgi:transcriptional antiterminator NusG